MFRTIRNSIREVWHIILTVLLSAAVGFFITEFILINATIPSGSMENTIMTGDRLFGNRLAYGINVEVMGKQYVKKTKDPERHDIVIFHYPDDEKTLFIKRVIGLPGDKIEINDGKLFINDAPQEEDFVREPMEGSFGPYEVPENCYFMMGDNRNNSLDSRYWEHTFVRFDQIVGKALFEYYPSIRTVS